MVFFYAAGVQLTTLFLRLPFGIPELCRLALAGNGLLVGIVLAVLMKKGIPRERIK